MTRIFCLKLRLNLNGLCPQKSSRKKKRGQFVNNGWKELRSVTKLDWQLNYGNETTLNIPPFWSVKSIHLLKSTSRSPYTSWIVFIEWGKWLPKWRYLKIKLKRTNVFIWSINGRFFFKEWGSLLVCAEEKLSLHGKRAVCTCMYEQLGLTQYEGF